MILYGYNIHFARRRKYYTDKTSKHILKTSCITYIVHSDKKTARDHIQDNSAAQKKRNTINY